MFQRFNKRFILMDELSNFIRNKIFIKPFKNNVLAW